MNLERVCTIIEIGKDKIFAAQDSDKYCIFVLPIKYGVPIGTKIRFKINKEDLKYKPMHIGVAHFLKISPFEREKYKVYTAVSDFKIIKGPLLPLEERNDTLFFESTPLSQIKIFEGSIWKSKNGRKITIEKVEPKKPYFNSKIKLKFGKSMKMKHLMSNYYPTDPNSIIHQ
jgi:hypothetical protein